MQLVCRHSLPLAGQAGNEKKNYNSFCVDIIALRGESNNLDSGTNSDVCIACARREKAQLALLLRALRLSVERPFQQLPTLTALFLSEAACALAHPAANMYPALNRHLLRRATLDIQVGSLVTVDPITLTFYRRKPPLKSTHTPLAGNLQPFQQFSCYSAPTICEQRQWRCLQMPPTWNKVDKIMQS